MAMDKDLYSIFGLESVVQPNARPEFTRTSLLPFPSSD